MAVYTVVFTCLATFVFSVLSQPDVLHTLGDHGDRITDLESKMAALTSVVGSLQTDLQRVLKENTGLKQDIQDLKSGSLCASVCPASLIVAPSSMHQTSPATLATPKYPNANFQAPNTSTKPFSASNGMISRLHTTNFPANKSTNSAPLSTSAVAYVSSSSTNVSSKVILTTSALLPTITAPTIKPMTSPSHYITTVRSSPDSASNMSTKVLFTAASLGSTIPSSTVGSTSSSSSSTTMATTTAEPIYRDCEDARIRGKKMSGATQIQPAGMMSPIHVYCRMATSGGWIVIQRRVNGNVSFDRGWTDYKRGFGEFDGDFWIGNELIHQLTSGRLHNTLHISMEDWSNLSKHAQYENFWTDSESEGYRLNVGQYSGNAGDSFNYIQSGQLRHNHMRFSTKDRDNDPHWLNCAAKLHGGWWFNKCYSSNLNGIYLKQPYGHRTLGEQYGDPTLDGTGVEWYPWQHKQYSLKFTEMMIKLGTPRTTTQ